MKRVDGRVERFHSPIYLPIPSENRPSCALRNGDCAQGTYDHLISGDGNGFSFMPFIQGAGKSDSPAPSQVSPRHVATAKLSNEHGDSRSQEAEPVSTLDC